MVVLHRTGEGMCMAFSKCFSILFWFQQLGSVGIDVAGVQLFGGRGLH